MHDKTIAQLSAGLAAGTFSSEELTRALLARIERFDPQLNAFITVTAERALAQARAADARRARGEAGPLTGIPIAHKDIFCTDGVRTSCGSRSWARCSHNHQDQSPQRTIVINEILAGL